METLRRRLRLLQFIPRKHGRISTRELTDKLNEEGFVINQRSVQRDLKDLATIFPHLESDRSPDIPGWRWREDTPLLELPTLDPAMALTFKLAANYLEALLPPDVVRVLDPYFERADQRLQGDVNPGYVNWSDKVKIVPRNQPLQPAHLNKGIITTLYQALFESRQVAGHYRNRQGEEAEHRFHPLGLVFRESVIYLVATVEDYQDPRHFALHRFTECKLLDQPSQRPEGFDLQAYIDGGSFQYLRQPEAQIQLRLRFDGETGRHLQETPLSQDQQIQELADQRLEITATVLDTLQLRWWLLGFGNQVEVIDPPELREEFRGIANALQQRYATPVEPIEPLGESVEDGENGGWENEEGEEEV
jgi:predicted DNA-binding transcriptional regulator YafY